MGNYGQSCLLDGTWKKPSTGRVLSPPGSLSDHQSSTSLLYILPYRRKTSQEREDICFGKTMPRAWDLKLLAHTRQGSQPEKLTEPEQQSLLPYPLSEMWADPKSSNTATALWIKAMLLGQSHTRYFQSGPCLPHVLCSSSFYTLLLLPRASASQ